MAEDQETPLKEEVAEAARESRSDMFLRKAREARARAGIEEEYKPDRKFNGRVDNYLAESATNLGDKLGNDQKEFLGTLLFTAAEKEAGEDWVNEGERRIDDKSLDEARMAAVFMIDEVEADELPSGLKGKVKELHRNIGKYSQEEIEERMGELEDWKKQSERAPLEIKAYEEWSKRWEIISSYNERLQISEQAPEMEEVVEEQAEEVEELTWVERWRRRGLRIGRGASRASGRVRRALEWADWQFFGIAPPEGRRQRGDVEVEEERESGLSRGMASLAETRDAVAWGNARLASQRAELEERIKERLEEEGEVEAVEEETEVKEAEEEKKPKVEKKEEEPKSERERLEAQIARLEEERSDAGVYEEWDVYERKGKEIDRLKAKLESLGSEEEEDEAASEVEADKTPEQEEIRAAEEEKELSEQEKSVLELDAKQEVAKDLLGTYEALEEAGSEGEFLQEVTEKLGVTDKKDVALLKKAYDAFKEKRKVDWEALKKGRRRAQAQLFLLDWLMTWYEHSKDALIKYMQTPEGA